MARPFAQWVEAIPRAEWNEAAAEGLSRYGARTTQAFRHLMKPMVRHAIPQRDWSADREALAAFQGWHDEGHCLDVTGHDWLWILERQATEGLAYYLAWSTKDVRLARCLAFLRALEPPPGTDWPDRLDEAQVIAEKPARGRGRKISAGRIDLLMSATAGEQVYGAVIEAKFGHDLGSNPLPAYHATAARLGLHAGNCRFVVLAIATDRTIQGRLKRNPAWIFYSWRRLLQNLERELPQQFDDENFKRFRRTLLDRSSR